ncbi:MAG: hypothetical protein FJ403_05660 [Verrucomicrobia bacterium]|nr:hypothetical protein [Verrucomicrobiota bacterium]
MTTTRFAPRLFLLCLALGLATQAVNADELKLRVQLVWGTNEKDAQKRDPSLKEVDPKLAERLKKVFKWEHYYVVKNKQTDALPNPVVIRAGKPEKLPLSEKCEIEIKNLGFPMLEVKLFGQGVLVKTVKQPVSPDDLIIGGDESKNDTAWFVVISRR